MTRQNLITCFRHLWRHRQFTALNIFGLAISISACWIIYRIVDYEFSFDEDLPKKENIYRVISGFVYNEKEIYNGGASRPLYQGIRQQIDGLKHVVPVFGTWRVKSIEVENPTGKPLIFEEQEGVVATDSSYFNMLPYQWLAGNKKEAFDSPQSVVLTENRAKQYFPGENLSEIMGKTITYYSYQDTVARTVKGVVDDLKAPSEFTSKEFYPLASQTYELNTWTNTNGSDKLYLELDESINPEIIVSQINRIVEVKTKEWREQSANKIKFKRWFLLLPLVESHFSTYINEYGVRKASKPITYGLIGVALFLLILACINYINMSIAALPQRAKEIGVRRTLGSNRMELIGKFLTETMTTALLACILAFLLSKLGFYLLRDIIPEEVTFFTYVHEFIIFAIVLLIGITILAGLYPAWLITKVRAIDIFRNTSFRQKNNKGFSLQKTLIVFQFTVALIFITSSIIVAKQLHYSLSSDMGFNKDAVVLADIPWKYLSEKGYQDRQFTLLAELKTIPGIQNISMGEVPMTNSYSSSQYEYAREGREPVRRQVYKKRVDTSYMDLYGIKLLAGRNLHISDTVNEYVINEAAVKAFGFSSPQEQEAIGEFIGPVNSKYPIVGVVKDFHLQDFYTKIDHHGIPKR